MPYLCLRCFSSLTPPPQQMRHACWNIAVVYEWKMYRHQNPYWYLPHPGRKLTFINLHPVNFRWQLLGRLFFFEASACGGYSSLSFQFPRLQRGLTMLSWDLFVPRWGKRRVFCWHHFAFFDEVVFYLISIAKVVLKLFFIAEKKCSLVHKHFSTLNSNFKLSASSSLTK